MMFPADMGSADMLLIGIIVRPHISGSDGKLEVPAFPKDPLVSVAYAGTVVPSFMPAVRAVTEKS